MRPLLIVMSLILLVLSPPSVFAGPGTDLAALAESIRQQANERADSAASRPAGLVEPLSLEDPFLDDMELFSLQALQLSRTLQSQGGAMDLQCIFRGMSEDAASQVESFETVETGADQARLYRQISELMRDAVDIAPDADEEQ